MARKEFQSIENARARKRAELRAQVRVELAAARTLAVSAIGRAHASSMHAAFYRLVNAVELLASESFDQEGSS